MDEGKSVLIERDAVYTDHENDRTVTIHYVYTNIVSAHIEGKGRVFMRRDLVALAIASGRWTKTTLTQ